MRRLLCASSASPRVRLHTSMRLLLCLVGLTARALAAPCATYCHSTCCSFSQPETECSGCDESYTCHPGAKCYDAADRPPAPPPFRNANGVCESICEKASCCGFSEPSKSCSGCEDPYVCRPGTECYEGGSAMTAAAARHSHSPDTPTVAAVAAVKRHAHSPETKKHDHAPKKRHEHAPKRKHAHEPKKSTVPGTTEVPTAAAGVAAAEAPTADSATPPLPPSVAQLAPDAAVGVEPNDEAGGSCTACEAKLAAAMGRIDTLQAAVQRAEQFADSAMRACDEARAGKDEL